MLPAALQHLDAESATFSIKCHTCLPSRTPTFHHLYLTFHDYSKVHFCRTAPFEPENIEASTQSVREGTRFGLRGHDQHPPHLPILEQHILQLCVSLLLLLKQRDTPVVVGSHVQINTLVGSKTMHEGTCCALRVTILSEGFPKVVAHTTLARQIPYFLEFYQSLLIQLDTFCSSLFTGDATCTLPLSKVFHSRWPGPPLPLSDLKDHQFSP